MTLSLTCRNCKLAISGEDEDELVAHVQEHVREHGRAQGVTHVPSPEQILARLNRHRDPGARDSPTRP